MKSYFAILRKKGDKTYYLGESRRPRQSSGIGYAWMRADGGLGVACLFESRERAESVARGHHRPGEPMPRIIEVQEQRRFVITALGASNDYWLQCVDDGEQLRYRWLSSHKAERSAYHFITRAAAEKVLQQVKPVGGGEPTVVQVMVRVRVERKY